MVENKSFFYKFIFKSITNGGLRSFVIFISIVLGSAICAAFINIYADIEHKVSNELNSYGPNVVIMPKEFENSYIDEKILDDKFEKISNLKAQNKYLFGTANIGVSNAVIMGMNFSNLKDIMPYLDIKQGEFIKVDFDDKNALIGQDLAKLIGAKVGDMIEITPNSGNTTKVKIKGIVYDGEKEDGLLIISLELAQKIFNLENKVNYANAIIGGNFNDIKNTTKSLTTNDIIFEPIGKISKAQGNILNKIKILMFLIGLVILIITSVCINTSLSSILLSRIKEFALIRAIGASKKNLLNIILSEIIIICVIGSLIGAILGYFLAIILGHLIFSSGVDFRFIGLILAIIVSLIFALLASYYPIKKALKPNLANLLRE